MSTYDKAKLTLPPCDPAGTGQNVTGVFVFEGDLSIEMGTRTGYLVDGAGSQINSILTHWYEQATGQQVQGDGKRSSFYLDLGSGQHYLTISFVGWEGSTHQWGDTGDDSEVTPTDATGASPVTQLQVLDRYLQVAEIDSREPHQAFLEVGEYSEGGLYSPIRVVVEDPNFVFDTEKGGTIFDGSITFIEAAGLQYGFDAEQRGGP